MNIIVAASENNAIGNQGTMPWHLRADLQYFKATTKGHTVIMGRKTYESIGRPLPGRRNVVVTRDGLFHISEEVMSNLKPGTSIEVYHSLAEAIEKSPADSFVIGGAQIYNQAWNDADYIYLTRVHTIIDDFDATIPPIPEEMVCISKIDVEADENNDYPVTFEVWKR
ncbi:MAG: dihydrofolate reductase [Bacteroidales bacterium]|nr:dihydrofolate reductase [Bacteroidales bacterium]